MSRHWFIKLAALAIIIGTVGVPASPAQAGQGPSQWCNDGVSSGEIHVLNSPMTLGLETSGPGGYVMACFSNTPSGSGEQPSQGAALQIWVSPNGINITCLSDPASIYRCDGARTNVAGTRVEAAGIDADPTRTGPAQGGSGFCNDGSGTEVPVTQTPVRLGVELSGNQVLFCYSTNSTNDAPELAGGVVATIYDNDQGGISLVCIPDTNALVKVNCETHTQHEVYDPYGPSLGTTTANSVTAQGHTLSLQHTGAEAGVVGEGGTCAWIGGSLLLASCPFAMINPTGDASASHVAISPTGNASGSLVGVSGTGSSHGTVAVSGTGFASGSLISVDPDADMAAMGQNSVTLDYAPYELLEAHNLIEGEPQEVPVGGMERADDVASGRATPSVTSTSRIEDIIDHYQQARGKIPSCYSAVFRGTSGTIGFQKTTTTRKGPGGIAWGVYMHNQADKYSMFYARVRVYNLAHRVIDGKRQPYEPHSVIPAGRLRGGMVLYADVYAYRQQGNVVIIHKNMFHMCVVDWKP